jgi:transcriptional regulator with XRE-family HTH domain
MAKRGAATVLPDKYKAARVAAGLTQLGLATDIGCSDVMITLIESGRRQPGLDLLIKSAARLGVGLQEIAEIHITPEDLAALSKAVA